MPGSTPKSTGKAPAKSSGRRRKGAPKTAEALLSRLDEVVRDLEGGDLPLEQALSSFEEGVKLVREGEELLGSVEQRIETLLADGSIEPFNAGGGESQAPSSTED